MTDTQWMIVLHITLIVLQALVAIVQYLLAGQMKQIRRDVRQMLGKPL